MIQKTQLIISYKSLTFYFHLTSPTPTYRWERTDKLGVTTNVFDAGSVLLRENNRQLTIKNIMKDRHAGTYTCHATIDDGGVKKTAQESSTVVVRGERIGRQTN